MSEGEKLSIEDAKVLLGAVDKELEKLIPGYQQDMNNCDIMAAPGNAEQLGIDPKTLDRMSIEEIRDINQRASMARIEAREAGVNGVVPAEGAGNTKIDPDVAAGKGMLKDW